MLTHDTYATIWCNSNIGNNMKFTLLEGPKKDSPEKDAKKYNLSTSKYKEFTSALGEWYKVYGTYATKPREVAKIIQDPTFKKLGDIYKNSTSEEQGGILSYLKYEIDIGHFEDLMPLYYLTHEMPIDHQNARAGMIGELKDIVHIIDSLGEI